MRDPDWLDAVPTDRPAVIVADGMMAFLSQDELVSLWNRLVSHFPSGELVFNSYTRFAIWIAQHARGTKSVADLVKFPGMDDARAPEGWNPKLKLVREILVSREPEVDQFPPVLRRYHRWPPTAPPGPGREPSSCTTASEERPPHHPASRSR